LALIYAVNPFGPDHQSSEHDPYYEAEMIALRYEKYGKRLSALGLVKPQEATVLNEEKVKFALYTQYAYAAVDTLDVCQFVYGPGWQLLGMEELAELWHAVTGEEITIAELQRIGARRLNMLRAFNAREGLTRDDDTLPQRLFVQPLAGGPTRGVTLDVPEFEAALDSYYRLAGWDVRTGNPLPQTLRELDLEWLVTPVAE
jgi:aldehyde:ferredoxin oxidoreductase